MDAERLTGPLGRQALALAAQQSDPGSLAAADALRRVVDPDLAAAALTQVVLRRRAHAKFGAAAGRMLLTADGLEQATRPDVATWRAERFVAAGVRRVIDLGCGLGSDAVAFCEAGLEVVAVEHDPTTAAYARHNLDGHDATVVTGDAEVLLPTLVDRAHPGAVGVFCDPARRTGRGRTWRVDQFSPPWDFVVSLLGRFETACVKLGPGLPLDLIPDGVEARWVSHRGDPVEVGLWRRPGVAGGRAVTLLPDAADLGPSEPVDLPFGELGAFVVEPDGALLRAGLVALAHPHCRRVAPGVGYLTCDHLPSGRAASDRWGTTFEVLEVLDPGERTLRRWVRENAIGTLEIKKRAVDLDPAVLRRRLKPAGPRAATIIITPTARGTRALVVRRVDPAAGGGAESTNPPDWHSA
ncbi:MAG: class I SAM-dependent methyltransferase [Propionibacterium sp.]|nr:class I SAM-dependent methyltransferase [Propionibacterium sp.]